MKFVVLNPLTLPAVRDYVYVRGNLLSLLAYEVSFQERSYYLLPDKHTRKWHYSCSCFQTGVPSDPEQE